MNERVPSLEYPNVPLDSEIPLAFYEEADADGGHRPIYTFDTPGLADSYVSRSLHFSYSEDGGPSTLESQYQVYESEIGRLRAAGIVMPHVFAALPEDFGSQIDVAQVQDGSKQDILLAAEKVLTVDRAYVDPTLVREQARRVVEGMAIYLTSSYTEERVAHNAYYLCDVFDAKQYIYGTVAGKAEPDFYMVDIGCEVDRADADEYYTFQTRKEAIYFTARHFGEMTSDPELGNYALGLLGMSQAAGEAAVMQAERIAERSS